MNGYWWLVYPVGVCIVLTVMALQPDRRRAPRRARRPAATPLAPPPRPESEPRTRSTRGPCPGDQGPLHPHQAEQSIVQAVGNVDLYLDAGETLGLVGESGCGKSMTGLSIMGLLPPGGQHRRRLDQARRTGSWSACPTRELRTVRGNEIAMVFQDPLTSLDPTKTIGDQVAEPVRLHRGASKAGGARPGRRGAGAGRPAAPEGAAD